MSGTAVGGLAARSTGALPVIRAGVLSRFYDWCDRLPWHGWWLFPAMAIVELAWALGVLWASGRVPVGTLDPTVTVGVVYGPYALGALAYLNRVAARALAAFWPATGWPDEARASWTRAFTTVRAGLVAPSLLLGIPVGLGAFLSAPSSIMGADDQGRLAYGVAIVPVAIIGYAMTLLVIAHTIRQLQLVARIHREAAAIDPFDRVPVYAFSRFTAQIGLLFLLSGYYTLTVNSAFQSGNIIGIAVLAIVLGLGAACFVLPLLGIHGRLVVEKDVLLAGVEARVSKLGLELYRRIDAGEFDGTKVISEAIAAAGAIRERIVRLPTWPWPPQLFRGFLSALFLPVIVYLVSRLIATWIGA
ncbi:MAG TPA: hypothetical protein VI814_06350 [Candidatus Limnocylindria bacterium]